MSNRELGFLLIPSIWHSTGTGISMLEVHQIKGFITKSEVFSATMAPPLQDSRDASEEKIFLHEINRY
jgi:hypothetical protein